MADVGRCAVVRWAVLREDAVTAHQTRRAANWALWNAVGGALLLCALSDHGVHWGALMRMFTGIDVVVGVFGFAGSIVFADAEAPPEEGR